MTALIAFVAAAISLTSCATTTPGPASPGNSRSGQAGSPRPGSSGSTVPATTPPTSATPADCPGGWRTGPLTVSRQVGVPPVPAATAIRTGSHPDCRFDRLVISISGKMPGYSARFVANVIQAASGKPITMPGTSHLLVTLRPAQGYSASGTPLLPAKVVTVGDPMLKSYAVAGDFEGVLSVALGLAGGGKYRIGVLPGRLYVDVAW